MATVVEILVPPLKLAQFAQKRSGAWRRRWATGTEGRHAAARPLVANLLVGASAIAALFRVKAWEEWANVVLGLAAIASPWILRFSESVVATSNIGIVVAALALWALATDKDIGGWWSPATYFFFEEHPITHLEVHWADLPVLEDLALADGHHAAFGRPLARRIRNQDAPG